MYRYYCLRRPPAPGDIPRGVVGIEAREDEIETAGGHRCHSFGIVTYARELTPEEECIYELELIEAG